MTLEELLTVFQECADKTPEMLENIAEVMGEDLVKHAQAKFGEYQPEIGPFPAWAELSPRTLEDKERYGYPTPSPLLREGDLRNSLFFEVERIGEGVKLDFNSDSPLMPVHEYGRLDGTIPPRPVLGPTVFERTPVYAKYIGFELETQIIEISGGMPPMGANKLK